MNLKFFGQKEIAVRPGLTLVRCETIGKLFVRESLERVEDLPTETRKEIEDFLTEKKS